MFNNLPYTIIYKEPSTECIKQSIFLFIYIVKEFAKYTGDLPFLSAVDIKMLALQLQLEKEFVGTDHIHFAPKKEEKEIKEDVKPKVVSQSTKTWNIPQPPTTTNNNNNENNDDDLFPSLDKLGINEPMIDKDLINIEEELKKKKAEEEKKRLEEEEKERLEKENKEKVETVIEKLPEKKTDRKANESHILGFSSNVTSKIVNPDEDNEGWITPENNNYIPPINDNFVKENKSEDKGIVALTTCDFYMQVYNKYIIECCITNGNENIII